MADLEIAGMRCSDVADLAPAFVLGALEAGESAAIRRHLASCPRSHPEVAELGPVATALFEAVELVDPPARLGDRILAAAAREARPTADTRPTATASLTEPKAPWSVAIHDVARPRAVRDDRSSRWTAGVFSRPIWAATALAAALAAVALGAWNVQLRDELAGLAAYRDGVVAVLDQAAQPGAQLAVLRTAAGADGPNGLAAVSSSGTSVSLVMRDLVPTSGTEVYEAWLIAGENAPVPIGHFTVGATGAAVFVTTAPSPGDLPALTVALTREPRPGATTPTPPIIVAGTAQGEAS